MAALGGSSLSAAAVAASAGVGGASTGAVSSSPGAVVVSAAVAPNRAQVAASPMPDLSHLTEDERRIIESVLMRQRREEEQETEIVRYIYTHTSPKSVCLLLSSPDFFKIFICNFHSSSISTRQFKLVNSLQNL